MHASGAKQDVSGILLSFITIRAPLILKSDLVNIGRRRTCLRNQKKKKGKNNGRFTCNLFGNVDVDLWDP